MRPWSFLLSTLLLSACEGQRAEANRAPTQASAAASAAASGSEKCEHQLPSSLCPKCNPQLAAVYKAKGNWCGEHGFPESFCPICHPEKQAPDVSGGGSGAPSDVAAIEARVVKLRDPKHASVAGLRLVAAREVALADHLECSGQIAYNQDKLADVRALVPGVVRRVRVTLGERVKRGAPLFDVQSSEVGQAQGALIRARGRAKTAKANLARQKQLQQQDIASARDVELAEQEVAAAKADERTALVTLRMTGATGTSGSGRYTLSAPLGGTVVARKGVVGLLATDETPLATIADISSMWVLCGVPEADAAALGLGQRVLVNPGGDAAEVGGEVSWIASEVDPRTRQVMLRAVVPNPEQRLRANQFVTAKIEVKARRRAVAVPGAAVQRVGERDVVFVRTAEALFAPRVVVRRTSGETVQVDGKLSPGDLVVTDGAVFLRTEIMPGSIGAGCCEVGPASEK